MTAASLFRWLVAVGLLLSVSGVAEPRAGDAGPSEEVAAFEVQINPEARVKLRALNPPQQLVRHRSERFWLKVHNEAGLQSPLRLHSRPNGFVLGLLKTPSRPHCSREPRLSGS
jgi:hypothetical protein